MWLSSAAATAPSRRVRSGGVAHGGSSAISGGYGWRARHSSSFRPQAQRGGERPHVRWHPSPRRDTGRAEMGMTLLQGHRLWGRRFCSFLLLGSFCLFSCSDFVSASFLPPKWTLTHPCLSQHLPVACPSHNPFTKSFLPPRCSRNGAGPHLCSCGEAQPVSPSAALQKLGSGRRSRLCSPLSSPLAAGLAPHGVWLSL